MPKRRKSRQEMKGTTGGIQIDGKDNLAVQIIQMILRDDELEIKKRVKNALDTYINTLLTDKNRIPLEFILSPDDRIKYDTIPLPAVFTELDVVYRLPLSQRKLIDNDWDYEENGEEGIPENRPVAAVQAVAENRHIVIIGDPGAGKTTLINYLCVIMASMLKGDQAAEELLARDSNGTWKSKEAMFPISIRLRDFGRSMVFKEGEGNAGTLAEYIADMVVREYKNTEVAESIRTRVLELLQAGGALIVMDGLDELPGETYKADADGITNQQYQSKTARARMKLQRILNSFTEHPQYGQCRVVVTSRSYAYRTNAEWRLGSRFAEAHLRDFEPKQIQEYINYWHIQIAQRKRAQHNPSIADRLKPGFDDKKDEATASAFWQALEKNKHMLELARRPLILTFIVSSFGMAPQVKSLPTVSKVQLYKKIVEMLTRFWSQHQIEMDAPDGPTSLADALGLQNDNQLEMLLSIVAFEAHKGMEDARDSSSAIITSDTLKHAWEKIGTIFNVDVGNVRKEVWMQLRERTGILLPYRTSEDGTEYLAFTHPSFQEWLAAKAITSKSPKILSIDYWPLDYRRGGEKLDLPDLVAGLIMIARERWQEVIALILESTIYEEPDTTWQIIARLVSGAIPETLEDNRWYGALLAGDFLVRNKNVNAKDRPEPETVKKWLVRSLQVQAMSIEDRVEVGRILSVLGDDRVQFQRDPMSLFSAKIWNPHNANRDDNLWVCVPATTILLGSPPQDVKAHYRSEEQRPYDCKRELQGFYISRYHITNDLFQRFVEEGYNAPECWNWSRSSLQWYESHPAPPQSNHAYLGNAPCRMVSWYEAFAFCQWLTSINPFNLEIFLPGESEWLAAACSDAEGRFHDTVYIWGDSLEEQAAKRGAYGNIRRLKMNAICSVGVCQPNKLSIFDMAGNVAEWTRSIWRHDLSAAENNQLDYPEIRRAVRGCSYRDIDDDIRVGHRTGMSPEGRYPLIGFRIAARLRN